MQSRGQSGKRHAGATPVRAAIVGTGGMARYHARAMLRQPELTRVTVVCEPHESAYESYAAVFREHGLEPPPNVPDLGALLRGRAGELDAAFIVTPHAFHHDQAVACLESGLDVLLEKPMVMNAAEARSLMAARDRTGRLVVVAFNGSLSPNIRAAERLLRAGTLGPILNIHAVVWQSWKQNTTGTWRQQPEVAGGGFLFDTGAHLLNTVSDLAGEDFAEVAAWLDCRGAPVDITATVMARLASGALVSMGGCGETINPNGASDVRIYCTEGMLRTGVWGERLQVQRNGDLRPRPIRTPASFGPWEQFLRVRRGEIANPCPPEVGLRMARLWDMIRASAEQGGRPVRAADL